MTKRLEEVNKVVGAKQVKRALHLGEVELVYIAGDADPKVIKDIEQYCLKEKITIQHVDSMKKLGEACGIDISAATAALLK